MTPEPPAGTPPADNGDQRRAPRVPMVRGGRIVFDAAAGGAGAEEVAIPGAVMDVSERGCQMLFLPEDAPDGWLWREETPCRIFLELGGAAEADLRGKVVWRSVRGGGETLVGFAFLPPEGPTEAALQRFVGARLRAGLGGGPQD